MTIDRWTQEATFGIASREEGQSMAEYMLLLSLVSIATTAGLVALRGSLLALFNVVNGAF